MVRLEAGDVYRPIGYRAFRLRLGGSPLYPPGSSREAELKPEHREVMDQVRLSATRQVAVVCEGFCPRCGLNLDHHLHPPTTPPQAWCQRCNVGWTVERRHVGELGWWVNVSEWDGTGRELSNFGWRYPAQVVAGDLWGKR